MPQRGDSALYSPVPRHQRILPLAGARNIVGRGLVFEITVLLRTARYPLSAPVIAMSVNRSGRQTRRALKQLIECGQVVRQHRAGEGRRNPIYFLRAAA